jgi:hypothetical protein
LDQVNLSERISVMKKVFFTLCFSAAILVSGYVIASIPVNHDHAQTAEHGGGLDRYGCHNDYVHGGYHCH